MPAGRPKKNAAQLAADQKVKDAIIEGISHGKTLRSLCREHKMGASTWYDWMDADGELAGRFARAREVGFDAIADEALDIANSPCEGEITTDDGEKVVIRKEDMLGHRKLQVETRLKLLAKWDPRRYGDSVQLKHADADGDKLDMGPTAVAIRAASLLRTALERDSESDHDNP